MFNFRINIKNEARFKRAFNQAPKDLHKNIQRALNFAAERVIREAKTITPVDSGLLRASIGNTGRQGIKDIKDYVAYVGTKVKYATYVHEGTRNWPLSQRPRLGGTVRQFLTTGLEKSQRQIQQDFKRAIDLTLANIAKKT